MFSEKSGNSRAASNRIKITAGDVVNVVVVINVVVVNVVVVINVVVVVDVVVVDVVINVVVVVVVINVVVVTVESSATPTFTQLPAWKQEISKIRNITGKKNFFEKF